MPFRNIFSVPKPYFNEYNKQFTVTHNTHPFCCSTKTHSFVIFAANLLTFIISHFTYLESVVLKLSSLILTDH